ncbi:FKBP-type peptidyl-prolyl cis-trans isomerase [Aquimarina algiphila]|uniref:FKBP-type peptidyl-prolyl cis-trans isomerase n=1 Tax=Aquimarina algiphila TaxID=2047982 RepID=UPI002492B4EC|nr:hypothetical protein [Aquimarina algiphila]
MKKTLIAISLLALSYSCSSDNDSELSFVEQVEQQRQITESERKQRVVIQKYLSDNSLTAKETGTGLYYMITNHGNGQKLTTNSIIKFSSKMYSLDGELNNNPIILFDKIAHLNSAIQEGLLLLKTGGSATLIMPSTLHRRQESLLKNKPAIFEIEILELLN